MPLSCSMSPKAEPARFHSHAGKPQALVEIGYWRARLDVGSMTHTASCASDTNYRSSDGSGMTSQANGMKPQVIVIQHRDGGDVAVSNSRTSGNIAFMPKRSGGRLHLVHDAIGFDLDEPRGIDEARNLHKRASRANVTKT